jgi:hypothetical protein
MVDSSTVNQAARKGIASGAPEAASPLQREYELHKALFEAQPPIVRHFLEAQARSLAESLAQRASHLRFRLPDQVVILPAGSVDQPLKGAAVPPPQREQVAGGLLDGLTGADIRTVLRHRLTELEGSSEPAVAAGAALIRYVTAAHLVYHMLPAGRSVTYVALEDEEIPTVPSGDADEPASAITADTDAIAEEGQGEERRGELIVPYVPAARRFYLPQWVAFDDEGHLLVNSVQEAEAHIASMQRFLAILHNAVALAPYMVADGEYQRKRYGILGQLINQGRALARHVTGEIIATIQQRASAGALNRGLSLSLPYFDDQDLVMKNHNFQVIPAGRIMFVPAFVVRAAVEEQAKVAQDTRLSLSTRKYLLEELEALGQAFQMLGKPAR